jgi:hypothetical protein
LHSYSKFLRRTFGALVVREMLKAKEFAALAAHTLVPGGCQVFATGVTRLTVLKEVCDIQPYVIGFHSAHPLPGLIKQRASNTDDGRQGFALPPLRCGVRGS